MTTLYRHTSRVAAAVALILGPSAALAADTVNAAYAHPAARAGVQAPGVQAPGVQAPSPATPASPTQASPTQASSAPSPNPAAPNPGSPPRELIVPDLAVVVPAGATAQQVAAIGKLDGVRAVLAVAGGQVRIGGRTVSMLGVPLPAFRSWVPPVTAAATGVWVVLADSNMVAASQSASKLSLTLGSTYRITGATTVPVPLTATAPLGIPGVDAIVNSQVGAQLGLKSAAVVLVNAPGADVATLTGQIKSLIGGDGSVINLVPVVQDTALPVTGAATTGSPTTWLQLYQDSAAEYCPGLSWTVLAAIGEIESDDGDNDGPSTAGALGPMQFMPGTWAQWGTDGFGETGPPDIMNPLDAVPSAARLLCADAATSGLAGLSMAIYDYNHATWYVSEVLDLAAEYAREYA
jgi:hypothetical protein